MLIQSRNGSRVSTHVYGPVELPSLAFAAIAAYPHDASNSNIDRDVIRELGYVSRSHVKERVVRWNTQDNGLYIPEPES